MALMINQALIRRIDPMISLVHVSLTSTLHRTPSTWYYPKCKTCFLSWLERKRHQPVVLCAAPTISNMCCPNNFQGTNNLDHKMNNSRGEQRYVAQFTTGNIVRFVWWSHDLARMWFHMGWKRVKKASVLTCNHMGQN
jgi:hypothetical protein